MRFNIVMYFLLTIVMSNVILAFNYSVVDGQKIPNDFNKFIGNQNVNVLIDNEFNFSIQIIDGEVASSSEPVSHPSLEIYLTNETLNKIEQSESPSETLVTAYKSGDIVIVKKTFFNKLKFFFARFFI